MPTKGDSKDSKELRSVGVYPDYGAFSMRCPSSDRLTPFLYLDLIADCRIGVCPLVEAVLELSAFAAGITAASAECERNVHTKLGQTTPRVRVGTSLPRVLLYTFFSPRHSQATHSTQ